MMNPLLLLLPLVAGPDFGYHHTKSLETFLKEVHQNHASITHLYSIGKSVQGRNLWVLALGRFPTHHKIGIPEFKYVANINGDETVGQELLLHLIDFLVTSYQHDPVITRLINSTRIHILPSMNPDEFETEEVPSCRSFRGRFNHNGVDLNRNFPDAFVCSNATIQPETQAVMNWINNGMFVLSANLHGGAVVASYPFDSGNSVTVTANGFSNTLDNDVFVYLARTYSDNHATMYKGHSCSQEINFPDGITNGYHWYPVEGGMQDYNYIWGQCFEITLELSCCKYPPANELPSFWNDNKMALIEYIKQVHLGVKGRVLDRNGKPISGAIVEVKGKDHRFPYRTKETGEYYLLLLPGVYELNVKVPHSGSLLRTLRVPDGTENFSALKYDLRFPNVSASTEPVASCPETALYSEDYSTSATLKPSIHGLLFISTFYITFR
ncbi:carboxypeptidase M [Tiliqua scincoides]|uniref:carboxypeptidase M n=1 Tax=Tiliqua scincoides TaxID=71010 RepID=UPI0034634B54